VSSRQGRRGRRTSQATGAAKKPAKATPRAETRRTEAPAKRPRSKGQSPTASDLLAIAVEAVSASAAVLKAQAAGLTRLQWEEKGPADYVTDVDRASESALRAVIRDRLPDARVLGEELSPTLGDREGTAALEGVVFVADPLDGTTNYLHGFPEYAVSIAVLVDGVLTAGVVRHGVTDETYTATLSGGTYRDGRRLTVSPITEPSRALIGTGFPFSHLQSLDTYQAQFAAVARHTAGMRRAGSAALDLARVAAGQFDGFWELTLAPWDIAAGLLLVREAGGIVTDLSGAPAPVAHTPIVAGNPAMHHWLLATLTSAAPAPGARAPRAPQRTRSAR
jgi:myo-inositol-1(or 4)-monophosphatase